VVQSAVDNGQLPASTAYAIAALDDPGEQAEVASLAVSEGLSRHEVVKTVRARSAPGKSKGRGAKPRKVTERSFRAAGCRVIVENRKGLDRATIRTALAEILAQLEAEAIEVAA
jgi:hypothetical protein